MADSYRYVFASCTLNMLHTYMDSQDTLKDDNDTHVAYANKYLNKDCFIYGDPVYVEGQCKPGSDIIVSFLFCPQTLTGIQTLH